MFNVQTVGIWTVKGKHCTCSNRYIAKNPEPYRISPGPKTLNYLGRQNNVKHVCIELYYIYI